MHMDQRFTSNAKERTRRNEGMVVELSSALLTCLINTASIKVVQFFFLFKGCLRVSEEKLWLVLRMCSVILEDCWLFFV